MSQTPTAKPQRDWDEIVKSSNGSLFHLPKEFVDRAKEWQAKRLEFNKKVEEVSRMENEINVVFGQLVFDIRKFFAENGGPETPWTSDFGFNTNALKEGKFIVEFMSNQK